MSKISNSYANYVNSFYSNDVNVLNKRKKQAKTYGVSAATIGTVAGALSLLPKSKIKAPLFVMAVVGLFTGINSLIYAKNANEKIKTLNDKA